MKKLTLLAISCLTLMSLSGCSSDQSNINVTNKQPLPKTVEENLSSYKARLRTVPSLPPIALNTNPGSAIVYLDPGTKYPIDQLQVVWAALKEKPTVVWVASPVQAQKDWDALGYSGDPLPSPNTLYKVGRIPLPDAYKKYGGKWLELPGVLPNSQVHDWITFFTNKK